MFLTSTSQTTRICYPYAVEAVVGQLVVEDFTYAENVGGPAPARAQVHLQAVLAPELAQRGVLAVAGNARRSFENHGAVTDPDAALLDLELRVAHRPGLGHEANEALLLRGADLLVGELEVTPRHEGAECLPRSAKARR